ncbi:MAG: MotA/TolQ/ExbB proton channel family protein [Pirellulales bacterium]
MNAILMAVRNGLAARRTVLMVLFGGALVVALVGLSSSSIAEEAEEAEEAEVVEEVEEPEAAPAAPAPTAASTDSAETAPPAKQTYLQWFYGALGFRYTVIFLALSFTFVALFVMNVLAARRENILPPDLIQAFEAHLDAKQYQEAYELARNDDSFLGKVLSAGLAKVSTSYSEAVEAMQEVGEDENMKLEQRLGYLALIGTIGPMFGLLGTVDGMVQSFTVIAEAVTAPKPSELAQGISKALVTTLVGLWIAIPAIAVHHILKNRIARLVLEVGIVSEGLMSRFQHMGGKKPNP